MAKHTDYIAQLTVLAQAAAEQARVFSAEREEWAVRVRDGMIATLAREWFAPLDREDIAAAGQCLVRLIRTIRGLNDGERVIAADIADRLIPLTGGLLDMRRATSHLSALWDTYRVIERPLCADAAYSPAFSVFLNVAAEYADILLGLILKYS